tara:strand:+ start:709 stop:1497 length:789 start_codon:yes stop_codon:yes gene_type:complete
MNFFTKDFDNKETYFEKKISNEKIPTIFIHGVGLDNTMWYPQKRIFKNESIIFYDILNHGKTSKKLHKLTFKHFSQQLDNLLIYLKINKVNLVGFSLGALIAQHFTSINYNKINKLVLIGSVYKRNKSQTKIVKNRLKEMYKGKSITAESIKRWFSNSYLKENPKVYKFFFKLLESNKKEDFIPAYKLFIESDKKNLNFSKFNMPTLIMTGENEVGSTPKMSKDIHKKIKSSLLHIVKNAKHGVTIEKANKVNYQLKKFLFN